MQKVIFYTADLKKVISSFLLLKCQGSVLPILEYMEVTCNFEDGTAKVRATNLQIEIEHKLGCEVKEDFVFITNFKKLYDLLLNIESDSVEIESHEEHIVVIADDFQVTIKTHYPHGDFVRTYIPENKGTGDSCYIVNNLNFYNVLREAGKFLSNDELRPSMTFIYLNYIPGPSPDIFFVATDAHLLFFRKFPMECKNGFSALIHRDIIKIVKGIPEQPIIIYKTEKHLIIRASETIIAQRLSDERYPDWQTVLPKDDINQMYLKKKRLELLMKISNQINGFTKQVSFKITPDKIKISSSDQDFGNTFSSELQVLNSNQEQSEFTIGFNPALMLKALSTNKEDMVKFSYSGRPNAAVIVNSEVIIMPVMLNDYARY